MASSNSHNHANLLREMARETTKSSRSSQRSGGSASPQPTISDFDPENEAIMSTQQLDNNNNNNNNAQRLPALRASAQKFNRFARPFRPDPPAQPEPDYAINTSAIGRAFPDFSQGGSSSDEGSMSIEMGRGAMKASGGRLSNAGLDLDEDSLDFGAPMIGDYVVTATPPLQQHLASTKTAKDAQRSRLRDYKTHRPSTLQKEIVETSPPLAKTTDYGSGESGRGSGDHGRTLAAMHARVRNEDDHSRVTEDRPPTIDLTIRNTRFGHRKTQQSLSARGDLPTKFSSTQGLTTTSSSDRKAKSHKLGTPNQGTQQSFLLPDMPNMSELVSGIFEDGTPVFSRRGKPRKSRFAVRHSHTDVGEVPVPEDEQAIFLSLKLLQDKIAVLEKNQNENEVVIGDLEQKNRALESAAAQKNKLASHRSNRAQSNSESDGEDRMIATEGNRLKSSVQALQARLDASKRKVQTTESILRTISQERDSAASQLNLAYVTVRQLQAENEDLREENELLRDLARKLPEEHKRNADKSRKSTDTGGDAPAATKSSNHRESPSKATRFAKRAQYQVEAQLPKVTDDADMFDLTPRLRSTANISHKAVEQDDDESSGTEPNVYQPPRNKDNDKLTAGSMPSRNGQGADDDTSRDLTYLSFLDADEVAKLRRTLEQERLERKQRQSAKQQMSKEATNATGKIQSEEQPQKNTTLPRKSSMKDLSTRLIKSDGQEDTHMQVKDTSEQTHQHPKGSILSVRSRRPQSNAGNMTSAYIIPDITLQATALMASNIPELTKENHAVLEDLVHHRGENCTVCKPNPINDGPHSQHITISKPLALSDRTPTHGPYEEEPTIRPSQSPGLALATVIKSLEDEIAHLKIDFAKYQALYNGHDPALGKRKRKSVQVKMQSLLQTIDVKSDQIYALYDVLEGQKRAGHELNDREVEVTLQSVGIDAASLHLRGGEGKEEDEEKKGQTTDRHPWDLSSEDESEEELPWEGLESTVETTKSGFSRSHRRKSAAT